MNISFRLKNIVLTILVLTFLHTTSATAQISSDDTPQLRIVLSSAVNGLSDETLLLFEGGTPGDDRLDMIKPKTAELGVPQIATLSTNGVDLATNAYGSVRQNVVIPLRLKAGVAGMHTLRFYEGGGYLENTCIKLENSQTNDFSEINEGDSINIMLDETTSTDLSRFKLHVTTSNSTSKSDISCFGLRDGDITILGGGNGPWTYHWYGPGGVFLRTQWGHNGVSKLDNARAGGYRIDVQGASGCGIRSSFVEITSPPLISGEFDIVDENCALNGEGSIEAIGKGGIPPYTYRWGDGSTDSSIKGLSAGAYSLLIYDLTGCSRYYPEIEVLKPEPPSLIIETSADHALINEPIYFDSYGHIGEFKWSFGDGTTSELEKPQHAYALPGIYDVELIFRDQSCVDTAYRTIEVGANGIKDIGPFSDVQVLPRENGVQINGADYVLDQSNVSIIDVAGRAILQPRRIGQDRFIAANLHSSGIYRVILTNPAGRKAIPVSIIR